MAHPVNAFKFCPRCGSDQFRVSGARSLTCDSCSLQWYTNSAAAVACLIFNPQGKLLVTRRAIDPDKGMMDLPGGFIDPMESAEEAVRRELREELNMEVKNMVYLASKPNEYFFSGITVFTTDLAFRVEAESLDGLTAHDDISSFEWIDPNEADPLEIPAPSIRHFIKEIAPHESNHR